MDYKGRVIYQTLYESPVGGLILTASEDALVALSFPKERYPGDVERLTKEGEVCIPDADKTPRILRETREWLDIYFSGKRPDFTPALAPEGSEFRKMVWEELLRIPYGDTMTYGQIAKQVAVRKGISHMSAQAVGGAVGHNPIGIIIPCHRVVGAGGNLTGFGGGIRLKEALLKREGIDMRPFYVPKKGTAL